MESAIPHSENVHNGPLPNFNVHLDVHYEEENLKRKLYVKVCLYFMYADAVSHLSTLCNEDGELGLVVGSRRSVLLEKEHKFQTVHSTLKQSCKHNM